MVPSTKINLPDIAKWCLLRKLIHLNILKISRIIECELGGAQQSVSNLTPPTYSLCVYLAST